MRGLKVFGAAVVLGASAVLGLSDRWPWGRLNSESIAPVVLPKPAMSFTEIRDTLRQGETLSDLFERHKISFDFQWLDSTSLLNPRRVRAGLIFSFRKLLGDSAPSHIAVRTSPEQRVIFRRVSDRWSGSAQPIQWQTQETRIEGRIENSLYEALDAGVPDDKLDAANRRRLAWDLADVYAWEVDFTRDIRPGDRFQVVFERMVSEEGEVRIGKVLASDLTISGKSLTAFRFGGGTGRGALYYDADGGSLRRAFLRAPVEFRRISSNFAGRRYHPVLGRVRRHEGTDYSAAPGTPVMAAGDGVVLRAGRAGGYGNLIELRHMNGITTRYGHLRAFARNIRRGVRVEQGQTIGYVGSTGLATGPHLHYEFRMNGVPKDSRRVQLGSGAPVPAQDRPAFEQERDRLLGLLRTSDSTVSPSIARQPAETSSRWLP
ncbi:MAG TPA: M23 family metallopeptidase [Gemmatimonadales bacterium]|nr:M23 family metallopeptidase [Gemmatimonadales bacterium]